MLTSPSSAANARYNAKLSKATSKAEKASYIFYYHSIVFTVVLINNPKYRYSMVTLCLLGLPIPLVLQVIPPTTLQLYLMKTILPTGKESARLMERAMAWEVMGGGRRNIKR